MSCAPLQDLWLRTVNTCVCTDLFTGFYTLWTSQLVTSLFLFLAVMLAAISWQYFDLPVMGYAVFVPAGSLAKVRTYVRTHARTHTHGGCNACEIVIAVLVLVVGCCGCGCGCCVCCCCWIVPRRGSNVLLSTVTCVL
jgi:hypothetical protein